MQFNARTVSKKSGIGLGIALSFLLAAGTAYASATSTLGDANGNLGLGVNALGQLTSGVQDTAVGWNALADLTTNGYDTAFGWNAGSNYVGTQGNHALTAFGAEAGANVTTGPDNSAFGAAAMKNDDNSGFTTGADDLAVGVHSLGHLSSGSFNVAVGNEAMVGCGSWAGEASAGCLLTGGNNTAVGQSALIDIQGGAFENSALGYDAGESLTTGTQNIFIGSYAGDTLTTGSLNIMIGRDVRPQNATGSNQLNIGNLIEATGLAQGGAVANGTVSIFGSLNMTGSLGVGTTNPKAKLDVASANPVIAIEDTRTSGDTETLAFINNDGTGNGSIIGSWWGGGMTFISPRDLNNQSGFHFISHGGTEDMTIVTASGNVGVGVTQPKAKLDVNGSINVGASTTPKGITLYDDVTGNPYCIHMHNGALVPTPGQCSN